MCKESLFGCRRNIFFISIINSLSETWRIIFFESSNLNWCSKIWYFLRFWIKAMKNTRLWQFWCRFRIFGVFKICFRCWPLRKVRWYNILGCYNLRIQWETLKKLKTSRILTGVNASGIALISRWYAINCLRPFISAYSGIKSSIHSFFKGPMHIVS